MNTPRSISVLAGSLVLVASTALASSARVFVSALRGNDTNPCTLLLPCRTFGAAINEVAAGGEIIVLDSGGYGGVTISKALTIESPLGVYAGVTVSSGDAITIAGSAGDQVTLRGLTFNGPAGTSGSAIVFNSGKALHVERCEVKHWATGLNFASAGNLFVTDSLFQGNTANAILVDPAAGMASVGITGTGFNGNANGILVEDGTLAFVRNCVFSQDSGIGVEALSMAGGHAEIEVEHCTLWRCNTGAASVVSAGAGSSMLRIFESTVIQNATGLSISGTGAEMDSFQDNHVGGNATDVSGTLTPVTER